MASTYTAQSIVNSLKIMPLLAPIFQSEVSGYSLEPGLTIINETMAYMMGSYAAWKWNEIEIAPFLTNSYQQDYATSNTNIGILTAGDCLDVNNTSGVKAQPQMEVVKDLPRSSSWAAMPPAFYGILRFQVCWRYNSQLYYGTWGVAQAGPGAGTRGNNPLAGSVYTASLSNGGQMPFNPIKQIKDANGNLLILTTFGTTGSVAPVLAANSAAGTTVTDGTCVWTVVDPTAQGFRIWPTPSQTGVVWQMNLRAQAKPPAPFTSLNAILAPIPDEYIHVFRQGCITTAYRYSPEEKVRQMYNSELQIWDAVLMKGRIQADREPENHSFIPVSGVVATPGGNGYVTPGNPWGTV